MVAGHTPRYGIVSFAGIGACKVDRNAWAGSNVLGTYPTFWAIPPLMTTNGDERSEQRVNRLRSISRILTVDQDQTPPERVQ